MSWQEAPLYVEAYDLADWLLVQAERWVAEGGFAASWLAPAVAQQAADLLAAISLALTFPASRDSHLQAADETLVRLRTLLRLGCRRGFLAENGLRHASTRLEAVGRMLGGWRKHQEALQRGTKDRERQGGKPPATAA